MSIATIQSHRDLGGNSWRPRLADLPLAIAHALHTPRRVWLRAELRREILARPAAEVRPASLARPSHRGNPEVLQVSTTSQV